MYRGSTEVSLAEPRCECCRLVLLDDVEERGEGGRSKYRGSRGWRDGDCVACGIHSVKRAAGWWRDNPRAR